MSVFEMRGPDFLAFYFVLAIVCVIVGGILRFLLRMRGGAPPVLPRLDSYEVAYLSGKEIGAVEGAIASLVHRGALSIESRTKSVKVAAALPHDAHALERALHQSAAAGVAQLASLREEKPAALQAIRGRLEELELIRPADAGPGLERIAPALLMTGVLIVGVIKIVVGLKRDRPVGFLVCLCAIVACSAAAFFLAKARRTRRGDVVLSEFKRQNAALQTTALRKVELLTPADIALALALFGPGVALSSAGLLDLRKSMRSVARSSGSSSCGSGGCGSSGCGGGGCGGGGCGGCGS